MTYWDKVKGGPRVIRGMVGDIKRAKKSPVAIQKITPQVKRLLEKTLDNSLVNLLKYAGKDMSEIPTKEDHASFPTRNLDGSVISVALNEPKLPKAFMVPIGGGIPFLEHVTECPFCQLMAVSGNDEADEETVKREGKEILSAILTEHEKQKKIN